MQAAICIMIMMAVSSVVAFAACPLVQYSDADKFFRSLQTVLFSRKGYVRQEDMLQVTLTEPLHAIVFVNLPMKYGKVQSVCWAAGGMLPWYDQLLASIRNSPQIREQLLQKQWMSSGFDMWLGLETEANDTDRVTNLTKSWYQKCKNGSVTSRKVVGMLPWESPYPNTTYERAAAAVISMNVSTAEVSYGLRDTPKDAGLNNFACVAALEPKLTTSGFEDKPKTTPTATLPKGTGTDGNPIEDKPKATADPGNAGLIAAIVGPAIFFLLIVSIVLVIVKRRRKKSAPPRVNRKQDVKKSSSEPQDKDVVLTLDEISSTAPSERTEVPNSMDATSGLADDFSSIRGIPIQIAIGGKNKCQKRKGCPCDICKARARLEDMTASTTTSTTEQATAPPK